MKILKKGAEGKLKGGKLEAATTVNAVDLETLKAVEKKIAENAAVDFLKQALDFVKKARTFQEVKNVLIQAEAIRAVKQQLKLSDNIEREARIVKEHAKRRYG